MAIGINDLYDDDDFLGTEVVEENQPVLPAQINPDNEPIQESNDDDFLSDFLRTRGIDDISKIKFEDNDGNIEEKDWNSLSKDEKINILNTPLTVPESNDLTNDEIALLNEIRKSNLTPQLYIESKSQTIVQEPLYKVDDYSDDELFILDLQSRVGELSEDEAAQALVNAKLNEDLFKKQVDGIRKEYKQREDDLLQLEQNELEQQLQEAYNQFLDSVINSITQFNSIGNLDLNFNDSDKEELASFMLARDESGNNYLWQALQDPDNLVKAAWFILNGEEAITNISDYFINQIKLVSENQYKKGFLEGQSGKTPSRQVVILKTEPRPQQQYNTIDDLEDDD